MRAVYLASLIFLLLSTPPVLAQSDEMTAEGQIRAQWLRDRCTAPKIGEYESPDRAVCIFYVRGFVDALETPPLGLEGSRFCLSDIPLSNTIDSFVRWMSKAKAKQAPGLLARYSAQFVLFIAIVQDYPCGPPRGGK